MADSNEMLVQLGYEMAFEVASPTPFVTLLNVHPDVAPGLLEPEVMRVEPNLPTDDFIDAFGNRATRFIAPPGLVRFSSSCVLRCSALPEPVPTVGRQAPVEELPADVLPFLLASRYCEVDSLSQAAWDLFGKTKPGWERAWEIDGFVQKHIEFGYPHARSNKTAVDVFYEKKGVCRDFMHLAITFCRAMGIPARYATGYLGDIAVEPSPDPMDYSAYYEVFLDGQWWAMDARHHERRVARVLLARGRDATDVALTTTFGRASLRKFVVVTDEIIPEGGTKLPVFPNGGFLTQAA